MTTSQRPELRIVRDPDEAPDLPVPVDDAEVDRPEPAELERVYEGEILPPEPERLPARIVRVVQIQPSPRARKAAGVAVTICQGVGSYAGRAYDGATLGVYRRQIRIAEATGDREALAEWVERKERAVAARRARLVDTPILVVNLAKAAGMGCAAAIVGLIALSTAVWALGLGEWLTTWRVVGAVLRFLLGIFIYGWPFMLAGVLALALRAAWREGQRSGEKPDWVRGDDEGGDPRDVIPDESAIINALRNLGIAELNRAFKAGWKPRIPMPTHRDGKGYRTQIETPGGVPVEMIVKKKTVLAHNLVRYPIEVWPTEPKPGVLDLWVADQGALSGPVPPWPLLNSGAGDYFRGVPVAMDIRGKSVSGRLFEANYAIAGMMGSGKSSLIITLLLGALLDPLVDADVYVMADNADYDPMKPRLRTLMTGAGDEVAEACLQTFRDLYADLKVRGQALKEHGARAASRQLAEKDERLRPRIAVVDECQALFMHEDLGEEALSIAVRLQNAARKYAITLLYATPEPSTASLPRRLITVTSNRACFAIGDQHSNDAVLGTGSYKAGISAVGLKPKTDEGPGDVGTFMGRGFTPEPSLLRGYFVSQAEAHQVVERAMQIRERAGVGPAQAGRVQMRDLIDDLIEVLEGESERVRLADVPSRLRRLAPSWLPYEAMTGTDLRDALGEYGIKVTNAKNVLRVDPADVRAYKARRDAGDGGVS